MRVQGLIRFLFVQYCVAAGVLLLVAPWNMLWERLLLQLPISSLFDLASHSWVRGGVSGFGLVHLVWAFHDLETLLHTRQGPTRQSPKAKSTEP